MSYRLKFHPNALQEWRNLTIQNRQLLKKNLSERLDNPHIPSARLSGGYNLYKIKFKKPPIRLTYQVDDSVFIVIALSIGMRDGDVYKKMIERYSIKQSK